MHHSRPLCIRYFKRQDERTEYFVCADKEDRIRRIMEKENLDYNGAKERVETTDEERASYYYEHTGKTWGDVNDYHMILDTSETWG